MRTNDNLTQLLQERLLLAQSKNPRYSLRAFAKSLSMPAPVLSELLRGKRKYTKKLTLHICDALYLSPEERENYLQNLEVHKRNKNRLKHILKEKSEQSHTQISGDQFRVIADWYCFAILSLAEIKGFVSDARWIATRLGIQKHQAETAIESLVRLNMMERKGKQLIVTGKQFATSNTVPSVAIKKNHMQGLELAQEALREVPLELREFNSNVIAINTKNIAEAKGILREAHRKLAELLAQGEKNEVYRLNVQLFPLSKEIQE